MATCEICAEEKPTKNLYRVWVPGKAIDLVTVCEEDGKDDPDGMYYFFQSYAAAHAFRESQLG